MPPQVFAETINSLEEVNLWSCNLTKTQVNHSGQASKKKIQFLKLREWDFFILIISQMKENLMMSIKIIFLLKTEEFVNNK